MTLYQLASHLQWLADVNNIGHALAEDAGGIACNYEVEIITSEGKGWMIPNSDEEFYDDKEIIAFRIVAITAPGETS